MCRAINTTTTPTTSTPPTPSTTTPTTTTPATNTPNQTHMQGGEDNARNNVKDSHHAEHILPQPQFSPPLRKRTPGNGVRSMGGAGGAPGARGPQGPQRMQCALQQGNGVARAARASRAPRRAASVDVWGRGLMPPNARRVLELGRGRGRPQRCCFAQGARGDWTAPTMSPNLTMTDWLCLTWRSDL